VLLQQIAGFDPLMSHGGAGELVPCNKLRCSDVPSMPGMIMLSPSHSPIPTGKLTWLWKKSLFFMAKSTINGYFNSYVKLPGYTMINLALLLAVNWKCRAFAAPGPHPDPTGEAVVWLSFAGQMGLSSLQKACIKLLILQ
jgi:hypothetical protein